MWNMQMFERSEAVPSSSSALLSTLEPKRRSRTGVVEKRKGYPREMAGAAVLLLAAAPPFALTCSVSCGKGTEILFFFFVTFEPRVE